MAVSVAPAGYSGMDIDTALYVLTRIIKYFMEVISEEAYTLTFSDADGQYLCPTGFLAL